MIAENVNGTHALNDLEVPKGTPTRELASMAHWGPSPMDGLACGSATLVGRVGRLSYGCPSTSD